MTEPVLDPAVPARGDDPPEPPAVPARGDDPRESPAVPASGAQEEPPPAVRGERIQMTVSTRDPTALAEELRGWLGGKLALNEPPVISGVRMPPSGGLSSTSLLFEAEWPSAGAPQRGAYVARMAPEQSAIPVFPRYDLPGQFRLIDEVSKRCGVPLPALRWNQPDGDPLGTAFFVMDQVEGRVPLDNPPYVFGGWLLDATPNERAQLERASVKIVSDLHASAVLGRFTDRQHHL
jgi:aminoglycoside phosphotransferase (APT) family kinase protein